MTTPSVRITDLQYSHQKGEFGRKVLSDISVQFLSGGITVLTGPSGSGKSTLLTIIGGLRRAELGSVDVLGTQLVGASEKQLVGLRRQIGFIFQQHNLAPALTIRQNIHMGLQLGPRCSHKEAVERIESVASKVEMWEHLDKRPNELSGGQQQRVGIARALVNEPKLILADEPTASLDRDSGQAVMKMLNDLTRQQDSTVLLVTHDKRILESADALLTLEDGNIIQPSDGLLNDTSSAIRALRKFERAHFGQLLSFSNALAQVALVDGVLTETEYQVMRECISQSGTVSDAELEFVLEMALAMAEGWREDHGDKTRRETLALALEAVAAADGHISDIERKLISQLLTPPALKA
ncbi:MAG: ATP-binding cassette domain-containing protein [Porticoccaceae bacterium]